MQTDYLLAVATGTTSGVNPLADKAATRLVGRQASRETSSPLS